MKIKILKENFPNEMSSGPSLGQPGPSGASMPEMKRKMMLLVDRIGKALDELVTYDKAYSHSSQSFINLKPAPKLRQNQYGESFYVYDENGEQVYETLEETALERAQRIIQGRSGTNIPRYKRIFGKTISQATRASELLEEVNHFLLLLETLEPDREVILYAKKIIYKKRDIHFKNAGAYLSSLDNYGDYLAATGLAIESISKVVPKLSNPGVGLAIKAIAETFTENYKSLWTMISEELIDSGDVIPSRRGFLEAIQPEVLKYMMRAKKPISPNDLLDDGFMDEMIEKYPLANTKARIRSAGTGRILLRKAFNSLFEKGYIIVVDRDDPFLDTEFVINPEMAQQAGEEYFPKPEGIMESKIKIKILKEATGEQKRQQKRDNYLSREKQRRKIKAKIKRSQNKGKTPFNKDNLPDFDPMQDMAKIFKDKGYGVRIDGEEIED
tara:strand:- start:1557 stop:2879 length:1323 start_codon:yes stop_codon:yes gene_type:complete